MRMDNPQFISVVMGVLYRKDDLAPLRRSVESILNQSYRDFEFLICDDGSTREAMNLLEDYQRKDARIRLIRPGDKIDLASKLNVCLKEAKGNYIARMDDDDCSDSARFEKQLHILDTEPDITFVGCNVRLWQDGRICGIRRFPEYPQIRDFYITQPYIHPTLLFRREALETVNGYSEDRHQLLCEDYDLLLRLSAKGYRGKNLQEELFDYTIPKDGKGKRKMHHRWNEVVTRWARFRDLDRLPEALPYVLKPVVTGLLPENLLSKLKKKRNGGIG